MRIALLNPWSNAAENQAVASIQIAAGALGHEAIECRNSAAIESARPDFVLAMASQQPKLTGYPTYGIIHEPRNEFVNNHDGKLRNILTYDGYFTISDALVDFLADLNHATRRPNRVGAYYNTCFDAGAAPPPGFDPAIVTYFGTNWDKRLRDFFRKLSRREGVAIYGPELSWRHINRNAYRGPVPFDGRSVLATYRANGVGLCLFSEHHLRDDVVSNRIFEIAAAGAIAITADMPWIRRHFGDAVLYIDQRGDGESLVEQVMEKAAWVRANPGRAREMAAAANSLFRERFSLERLMRNVVACHEKWTSDARSSREDGGPLVSVIVRAGGRPVSVLRRAIDSLARQYHQRIEVLLVVFSDLDVDSLQAEFGGRFAGFRVIRSSGKLRSNSLWAGLREVKGEYFAILDDDDELFPGHFSSLIASIAEHEKSGRKPGICHAGAVRQVKRPFATYGGSDEVREVFSFAPYASRDSLLKSCEIFSSNCFIARTDLLDPYILEDPDMDTAEDSYLLLALSQKSAPVFNYALTSLHHQSAEDGSNFRAHPRREEDLARLVRRLFARPLRADEDLLERFRMDHADARGQMRLSQRGAMRLFLEMAAKLLNSLAADGFAATLAKVSEVLARKRRDLMRRDR